MAAPGVAAAQSVAPAKRICPFFTKPVQQRAAASALVEAFEQVARFRPGLTTAPCPVPAPLEAAILACADARCVAEPLGRARLDLALVVTMDGSVSPPFISMLLADTKGGDYFARIDREMTADEANVVGAVARRSAALLEQAGFAPGGRLVVEASPAGAGVAVRGASAAAALHPPLDAAAGIYVLSPGPYSVEVSADGHDAAQETVDVVVGEQAALKVALEPEQSIVEKWWFWTGIVAVVGGATAAIAVAAQPEPTYCLCVTPSGVPCSSCP